MMPSMSDFNIDLVFFQVWEGVRKFLERCPNASKETVEESVLGHVFETYKEHLERRAWSKLRREFGKAYDATAK
jgi:hypothetical protein